MWYIERKNFSVKGENAMKPLHDIHTHNFLSSCCFDPTASVENFIKRSKENGLRLLGFSNHTWDETVPGASPW